MQLVALETGDAAPRLHENVAKLEKLIKLYCSGNPYENNFPLRNIVSSVEIPDDAKKEILNFDVLGEELYEIFVLERLAQTSKMKVCDSIKLAKTKTMNTWMNKIEIKIDDKVIKLREERHLLARFLIIQQSRKLDLQNAIGNFEMSLIPRALFTNDCNLYIPACKSKMISLIEDLPSAANEVEHPEYISRNDAESCIVILPEDSELTTLPSEYPCELGNVAIIDAMAIVQTIKKNPTMKKMSDFRTVFCKKIQRRVKKYTEARVVFDEYLDNSLKEKTRAKRTAVTKGKKKGKKKGKPLIQMHYNVTLNQLFVKI